MSTICSECDLEAEEVFGDMICPECGTVFDCEFCDWCDGPVAEGIGCFASWVGRIPLGFQE